MLLVCLYLAGALLAFAQNSGRGFSYQAVARNTDGSVKASENIEIRFSLLPGNPAAAPEWQETQVATTDGFGVFNMTIGKGIKAGGTAAAFAGVNFAAADFWLKVELYDNGAWKEISATQLLSVPYAEVAGNASPAPTGSIMAFAGKADKVPPGWRLCDGAQLSRVDYGALYAVIGTNWGAGDGANTFHLPDLRTRVLRGVAYDSPHNTDDERNNRSACNPGGNTNNEVGSVQGDEVRTPPGYSGSTAPFPRVVTNSDNGVWLGNFGSGNYKTLYLTNSPVGTQVYPNGGIIGSETRSDNAYINYIIKL